MPVAPPPLGHCHIAPPRPVLGVVGRDIDRRITCVASSSYMMECCLIIIKINYYSFSAIISLGDFEVTVNDQLVYSKQTMGCFPDFQAVSRQHLHVIPMYSSALIQHSKVHYFMLSRV